MKRRFITVMVYVLLLTSLVGGAVVNVAVAWGCVLWQGTMWSDDYDGMPRRSADAAWLTARATWQAGRGTHISERVAFGLSCFYAWVYPETKESVRSIQLNGEHHWRIRVGWPMRSLEHHSPKPQDEARAYPIKLGYNPLTGSLVVLPNTLGRLLPAKPMWWGFAINTMFYAAMLWGLFAMPWMIRRRWRAQRGLCAACGYPVGSSAVCTECGGAVTVGRKA